MRARPSWRGLFLEPVHFIASGFGAGMVPAAPGTCGTLVAVPLYVILLLVPLYVILLLVPFTWRLIAVLGAFLLGIWVCGASARRLGVHDPSVVVFDEIVAYLFVAVLLPLGWSWLAAGFVVFRVFDIIKPWPIRVVDRGVMGGFGIMLDDVLAGVFALIVLWGVYGLWLWAE